MFALRSPLAANRVQDGMNLNQILVMIGDWPVRVIDALLGFGGLVLVPAWVKVVRPRFLSARRPVGEQRPVQLAVG